jgi:hypothetical protein
MYELTGDFTKKYFNYADPNTARGTNHNMEISCMTTVVGQQSPSIAYMENPKIGNYHTLSCPYVVSTTFGRFGL